MSIDLKFVYPQKKISNLLQQSFGVRKSNPNPWESLILTEIEVEYVNGAR
jgi:hypothetical protein